MTKTLYGDEIWKARCDELEARLEALEGKQSPVESEAVDTSWPQEGDDYWYLDGDGEIFNDSWGNTKYQLAAFARDSLFRTREEAEKADQLRLAMNELKVMSEEAWIGGGKMYCFATYSDHLEKWSTSFCTETTPGVVYFPTESAALEAHLFVDAKYPGVIR